MNMILICANLQKLYLVPLLNVQADLFQLLVYSFIEHNTPIFGKENQMIDREGYIMAFMNIFTHTPIFRRKRRGIHPKRLKSQSASRFCDHFSWLSKVY